MRESDARSAAAKEIRRLAESDRLRLHPPLDAEEVEAVEQRLLAPRSPPVLYLGPAVREARFARDRLEEEDRDGAYAKASEGLDRLTQALASEVERAAREERGGADE